ncbi:hypothetical protein [Paraferrimonas sedimenticola]|uniref:Uncharacterized protein n=1 Tax=Paraferrimonas sedimenticola TaxID=375674 RepID=A0AA37RRA4_9GAMM|nr:hypothetical protein [Paraferrimonas sedimenticola]GLP95048.1 hypothetical protein GCM10007895_03540 [Paraferrimonas sedimenticola]
MQFDELKSVLDTDNENELILLSPNWKVSQFPNTESGHWLSKEQFHEVFSVIGKCQSDVNVFAFETFERVYKATGSTKRLNSEFNLNWTSFNNFQRSTDILCFYLVPQNLSWVFYGNRDYCLFAKGN